MTELRQIIKTRAEALGANAVVSFKCDLSKIQQRKQQNGSWRVFVLINGIGDAVKVD